MATAYVQSVSSQPVGSDTTISVAMGSNVGAGAVLVAWVSGGAGGGVTFSDDKGNTWVTTRTVQDTSNSHYYHVGYAKNCAAGATTVTCSYGGSYNYRQIVVHEVSGCDATAPLDVETGQFQNNPGTSTDAVSSGSVVTTVDGCYIFGISGSIGTGSNTIVSGTGYTTRVDNATVNFVREISEDKIQSAAGTVAATFTANAGGAYVNFVLAFKPAGAGASKVPLMMQHYN